MPIWAHGSKPCASTYSATGADVLSLMAFTSPRREGLLVATWALAQASSGSSAIGGVCRIPRANAGLPATRCLREFHGYYLTLLDLGHVGCNLPLPLDCGNPEKESGYDCVVDRLRGSYH